MKRNLFFSAVLIIITCACSTDKTGGGSGSNTSSDSAGAAASGDVERVRTVELTRQVISRSIEYTSNLIPFEENHLAPATPGRIEKIFVEIGDHVSKGDMLVQMDRTQLYQALIQLKNIETDFARLDTLNKVGSISKQQYDQVKAQYDITRSSVEFLQENTVLRAPFNGVISGKYYEEGELYSGAPNTMAGKAAIVSIVQIDLLKAEVSISEKYFPLMHTGMDAMVTTDTYPGKTFPGKVMRIHPTIDQTTRSFTIEIKISNQGEMLRPGMFSRVSMEMGEEIALVVPSVAVLKLQGSNERYVFMEENGVARRITVTIGKRFDDKIEIISDKLKEGNRLIITGQARLVDGDKVLVSNEL